MHKQLWLVSGPVKFHNEKLDNNHPPTKQMCLAMNEVDRYVISELIWIVYDQSTNYFFNSVTRGKSLLESWVTTFLPDWQLPLIFVRFISKFLCMCSNSVDNTHVILK